jgi:hypothetical protein
MSTPPPTNRERGFDWPLCHKAEQLVLQFLEEFCACNSFAAKLARRMSRETGTLLLDWVDHLVVPARHEEAVLRAGYVEEPRCKSQPKLWSYRHPRAMLPAVRIFPGDTGSGPPCKLALRVESVVDFIIAHGLHAEAVGAPWSRYRTVEVSIEGGCALEAVERRGYRGYERQDCGARELELTLTARELFHTRRRQFDDDVMGFHRTIRLVERIVRMVGRDLAAHFFWEAERAYWLRRNCAGQIQKRRQDALGLGWANHDHHTPRCSRRHFLSVMHIMELLGFERRERYHAGHDAGWGAQIMEHPVEPIVAFCDVDLLPEEREIDFSRVPLPETKHLGTVGLWTGLHGDSLLEAGMHHLEARFDFELLRDQLAKEGVNTMKPFSDFDFLKQAFTEGERWPVRRERAQALLDAGSITQAQFYEFTAKGAIGSHLENLQRKGGFKGFNQKSVSAIIAAVDPRKQVA